MPGATIIRAPQKKVIPKQKEDNLAQPIIQNSLRNESFPPTPVIRTTKKVVPVPVTTRPGVLHTTHTVPVPGTKTRVVKTTSSSSAWVFFAVGADAAAAIGLYFLLAAVILVSPVLSAIIAVAAFVLIATAIGIAYNKSDEKDSSQQANDQSKEMKREQDRPVKEMHCKEETTSWTEKDPNSEMGEVKHEETKITEKIEYADGVA